MNLSLLLLTSTFLLSYLATSSSGWVLAPSSPRRTISTSHQLIASSTKRTITTQLNAIDSRRSFLTFAATLTTLASPLPASALVKGNAPPPKAKPGERPKCTNVEECQALAAEKEQEIIDREQQGPPPLVARGGTRYRDLEEGTSNRVVQEGDLVKLYYKVLKLGKRSYDGLSGEGTVVFSRGYGLEDDEDKAGDKYFETVVGNYQNIAALNDALVGMRQNQVRRLQIMPQQGWEKATKACDGGPGGAGDGGSLTVDYFVVPTATVVNTEVCFDKAKIPFPSTYAQERRMAQRFDQGLIMEVQVVDISKP